MIHNIEEKQKLYERRSPVSSMLNEEELAQLIAQVEERELLHAPAHLKENVFLQVERQKRTKQKLQLFTYRTKVLVGMAAALAVLFVVPVGEGETGKPSQSGIFDQILWQEQEDVDEIEREAFARQQKIERTWQKYQEEQERETARENYLTGIGNKIRNLRNNIF